MINDFLARFPGFKQDFVYKLIAYQDLKLCLDIGAAAGVTTRWIKDAGSADTKVIGFEPFPGNHAYFLKNTKDLSNVELVKKAVSSKAGYSSFRVLSTVQGSEKGWQKMAGYSSTGFLIDSEETKPVYTGDGFQELKVETIAIADLVDTHVDFMKIDVQGGEYDVLLGCEPIIREHGIDVMYVEFDGDSRIINFLSSLGYSIFDTDYLLIPKKGDRSLLDNIGFYEFKDLNLSTGRKAYRAKLRLGDGNYCQLFDDFRSNYGSIYTDLICVSEPFLTSFVCNLGLFFKGHEIPKVVPKTLGITSEEELDSASKQGKENERSLLQQSRQVEKVLENGKEVTKRETRLQLTSSLLGRIAKYYGRWPIVLAIFAIVCSVLVKVEIFTTLWRWPIAAIGIATILFLIGHAASKADYALAELVKLKSKL